MRRAGHSAWATSATPAIARTERTETAHDSGIKGREERTQAASVEQSTGSAESQSPRMAIRERSERGRRTREKRTREHE